MQFLKSGVVVWYYYDILLKNSYCKTFKLTWSMETSTEAPRNVKYNNMHSKKILFEWERVRTDVCMFLQKVFQRLSDIFEDLEEVG